MPITTAATPNNQLATLLHGLNTRSHQDQAPWQRHWLVIPSQGRAEWLQRAWAKASGVATRSQVITVRALVELAARGDRNDDRPIFDPEGLVPIIAGLLQEIPDLPIPQAAQLDHQVITPRHLSWARQLLDALDLGLLCRPLSPEEQCQFSNAPFLAWLAQHPRIVPLLRGHLGYQGQTDFVRHATAWKATWEARRSGLPRLHIALDTGLPQVLTDRLHHLLGVLPDDAYHLNILEPLPDYWGDLKTGRKRWDVEAEQQAGPILRPFGRRLQDLHNQSVDYDWPVGGFDPDIEVNAQAPQTVLQHLQQLTITAEEPVPFDSSAAVGDTSLSVHGCPSALRELEVCRDRILHAMATNPRLATENILLLLPSPETYAPYLSAALQPQADQSLHIPFRAVGMGSQAADQCSQAIALYVRACAGRLDQATVLACLEHPLISEAFELTEDASTILDWLQAANFHWGIDEKDRQQQHPANNDTWSLSFALRRLALGAISPMSQ
ncbi:MAG: exodeoxyribonuclease V subunit gamma, partial [Epibacterium sp.]|nr:exodeoxyribonuclease V subunit gamma [Epibacterium sp.]NQX76091.1 exodeoxyribonuclease V subunit gamma [Epibacterium sp.]